MKKIINPWRNHPEYNCFGCCPDNPIGLHLEFYEDGEGMIDIPNEMDYYGEHSFQMQYKDTIGEPFDWLYIDTDTLKQKAGRCGYTVELVAEGEHYDYLARITQKEQ